MIYLLIILLIILAWRFYHYFLLPANHIRSRMNDAQTRYRQQQQPPRRPGETEIEYVPKEEKRKPREDKNEAGEYIDYEEVR
ncbi:MAG: DUF4834 family protein [Bacteroidia bacterium]